MLREGFVSLLLDWVFCLLGVNLVIVFSIIVCYLGNVLLRVVCLVTVVCLLIYVCFAVLMLVVFVGLRVACWDFFVVGV